MDDGWETSAKAWITSMGDDGDYGRVHVLDTPMLARAEGALNALDVGCGEGRFCRKLQAQGTKTTGTDPTPTLLAAAQERDPEGTYLNARAEALPFEEGSFDLVVSYLTLIDIPDTAKAIPEMARVLAPGGKLLVANLQNFNTASNPDTWGRKAGGAVRMTLEGYLDERPNLVAWRGIKVENWHRPLSHYMTACLDAGLTLTHFAEPRAEGGDPDRAERYNSVPYFLIMEWQK